MFLNRVIRQYVHEPVRYLDLCAAPGGKSTDAVASLPVGSLIVSNEVIPNRAHILTENIVKWGSPYCIVTRNEASAFGALEEYFDIIAADVPCSGEGMFRKDPAAITEWSAANVAHCAERQRAILTDVWNALRPGGLFIYSTCTYNTEENEEMIGFLRKKFGAHTSHSRYRPSLEHNACTRWRSARLSLHAPPYPGRRSLYGNPSETGRTR